MWLVGRATAGEVIPSRRRCCEQSTANRGRVGLADEAISWWGESPMVENSVGKGRMASEDPGSRDPRCAQDDSESRRPLKARTGNG